jgi:hypothetical protein
MWMCFLALEKSYCTLLTFLVVTWDDAMLTWCDEMKSGKSPELWCGARLHIRIAGTQGLQYCKRGSYHWDDYYYYHWDRYYWTGSTYSLGTLDKGIIRV